MSLLAFLSAGTAAGVVELRGDVGAFEEERIVRLTPRRAVALTDDAPALVARARASGLRAYDLSAGHAEIRIEGDALLRRLTDAEVDGPTAAPVARGVPTLIFPRAGGYDLYVPQELARYARDVVADLEQGLA
jgi:hypothetical protein